MKNPEKYAETFIQTFIRTILTSTIIAVIIFSLHLFPAVEKSKITLFVMIWSIVFSVVFGCHWLELVYINRLKFTLPANVFLLYGIRIGYWFLCAIPLFLIMNLIIEIFSYKPFYPGFWWKFGLFYIGIQLIMHALMQLRFTKSFYNGVY